MRIEQLTSILRLEIARSKLFQLEGRHKLISRFGYLGENASITKALSHNGGFDVDLASINLMGPGPEQQHWRRYLQGGRASIHKVIYRWGKIRYVDPGNAFYWTMMHVILADWPADSQAVKDGMDYATIRNMGPVKVGDVFEAILACYLFLLDPEDLALLPSELVLRTHWVPRILRIATPQVFIDYGLVLHEIYSLIRHFMRQLTIHERQHHLVIHAAVSPVDG